jgi:hypothetical protein
MLLLEGEYLYSPKPSRSRAQMLNYRLTEYICTYTFEKDLQSTNTEESDLDSPLGAYPA